MSRHLKNMLLMARIAAILLCSSLLCSCDVHEVPYYEYGEVEYTIDLVFDKDWPLYKEITFTRSDSDDETRAENHIHDVRYLIKAFPAGYKYGENNVPAMTFVFTDKNNYNLDRQIRLNLPEGKWDLYVWTDFVNPDTQADKYYDTSDFAKITYPDRNSYSGSNLYREAFRGMATVEIIHPYRFMECEPLPAYSVTIPMQRPMGRFEFISTDVEEFIQKLPQISTRFRNGTRNDLSPQSLTRSDLEEFKVVFRYTGFMPSVFNTFTNKPIDSWTGMSFESKMDVCEEGIILGFDHVLLNGEEDGVNVAVEIYAEDGTKIASSPGIEVPLLRGRHTVVKSEFLTTVNDGGVGINPGFDGDYNIEFK